MTQSTAPAQNDFFLTDITAATGAIDDIALSVASDFDAQTFGLFLQDAKALFAGDYPGYRASNTMYHDFSHTISVVLATVRLIHGCMVDGFRFSGREVLLTLTAALFHDVGLIQKSEDTQGSGAKYTVGHEERSIVFLREYFARGVFSDEEIETCANFIRCTILSYRPRELTFTSDSTKRLGFIVGAADLMAQMADRLYLEKLLLLYKEFEEARLPGFDSELQLLQKTKDFYEIVARKRFDEDLESVHAHMRSHFKGWFDSPVDGYTEAIDGNIRYLEALIDQCQDCFRCYLENLKRGGIAEPLLESLPPPSGS
ncbi:MAG: HD domain-containing protein [Pseudomonadota bacterium]